jgi:hypothetical protein
MTPMAIKPADRHALMENAAAFRLFAAFIIVSISLNLWSSPLSREQLIAQIRSAKEIIVYSLEPAQPEMRDSNGECMGLCYYGWPVLGQVTMSARSNQQVKQVVNWLKKAESEGHSLCFEPRHGIRVVTSNNTLDFVICFECDTAEVYVDAIGTDISLEPANAQKDWDRLLKKAGVKLAQPAE